MANKEKAGKPNQSKKLTTRVLQVPIRVEIKPDGRVVWDVNEVHKALAKQIVKDPSFEKCTQLVKKDPASIKLNELRNSVIDKSKTEVKEKVEETSTDAQDSTEIIQSDNVENSQQESIPTEPEQ